MTIADDFHATVNDWKTLQAFMQRHAIHPTTEAVSLVYAHDDGRMEHLTSYAPKHPASAAVYVIREGRTRARRSPRST